MALEEFILDLCEESVNAALLVIYFHKIQVRADSVLIMTNADLLVLPNIPP
jgi:hypothetical protein